MLAGVVSVISMDLRGFHATFVSLSRGISMKLLGS